MTQLNKHSITEAEPYSLFVYSLKYPIRRKLFFRRLCGFLTLLVHLRREPVLGLKLRGNQLDVFTGHSIATMGKGYTLEPDGTLTLEYQEKLHNLKKLKKQRPPEKVDSLLALATSNNEREVIEGLSQLASFAKTKCAMPHYTKIVNALDNLLQGKYDLLDPIWKVIRQIMKRQPEVINPIVPNIISKVKKTCQYDDTWLLAVLGELGGTNLTWVIAEEQFIKQKLRSNLWNERRFAAFAVGAIGSVDPSLVKDVIPLLIEYAADPESVRKDLDETTHTQVTLDSGLQMDFSVSMSTSMDGATWLREACIDAIGMIGKRSPESVSAAIPLLEKLSKDTLSPYTVKKAISALNAIRGRT